MSLVSCISTMNVDRPRANSSEARERSADVRHPKDHELTAHAYEDAVKHPECHRLCWDI